MNTHFNQTKIRIAILADVPLACFEGFGDFGPIVGHYPTWLEALVPCFESIGDLDMHWVVMSKRVKEATTRKVMGQTFHVLPRWKKAFSMVTCYYLETRRIRSLVKSLKPDVLHAWGCEDVYGIAGSRSRFVPRVFTLQGCIGEAVAQDSNSHRLLRLQSRFEKPTVAGYRIGTGESTLSVRHLERMNSGMCCRRIEYGVSSDFFRAKWKPRCSPTILYAGSLIEAKGVSDLVEVFRRPELKDCKLVLAGDGPLCEWIRKLDLPNITVLGRVDRSSLVSAMENSWCLVAPTYADTGPSVVKEARVVGLPVITTSAAGVSGLIADSGCGYVVRPGDPEDLLRAVGEIIESREHCLALGKRGWDIHRELLQPARTAQAFAELYREMTSSC